jgi:hypothetical protein
VSRLRAGEWLTVGGAAGLFVVLFLDWFEDPPGRGGVASGALARTVGVSGWSGLGWFMDVLLLIVVVGGLAVAFTTVKKASPAMPVGSAVLTFALGAVVLLALAIRVLTRSGGLGAAEVWAYAGLLLAALIPAGAFLALKDERTQAPESAYTPPPARPVPGS